MSNWRLVRYFWGHLLGTLDHIDKIRTHSLEQGDGGGMGATNTSVQQLLECKNPAGTSNAE